MLKEAVRFVANAVIAEKNHLTMLDTKIGDGDHGLNMARGATAVLEAMDELDDKDLNISVLCNAVGQAIIMNVGGAAGPLYGTGFVEGAKTLDKNSNLDAKTLEKFFEAAIAGIQRRGHAKKGDKTMLDTLIPIYESFQSVENEDKPIGDVIDNALTAAREGVEFTKTIAAKRGRASYIGERSIGIEDPGAVSSLIIFRTFCQFLKDKKLV